jgi:threonine-phosphate decarboxylase
MRHGGGVLPLARRLRVDPGDVLDLSVSLNPCAPDVVPFVRAAAHAVRRYPDAAHATSALAQAVGVDVERVVLTNGGAEAIALVAARHPEGHVDPPEFSLYSRHLRRLRPGAKRWRSNPNNPTGQLAAADAGAGVWDEAFFALATGRWTRGDADAYVVGSLTKLYACPGLRVGYVIAPDAGAAVALRACQPEWAVDGIACEILPRLLDVTDLAAWARQVAVLRDALVGALRAHGLAPDASDANYVLSREAPGLFDHLASRAVLVRDTASFDIPGGVRIAVPDELSFARLVSALQGYEP